MGLAIPLLMLAIGVEVAATAALPRADGFRDPLWTVVVLGGYAIAIWLLSVVVEWMQVSVAYAIWAGLGTALIAVVGVFAFGEPATALKVASLGLIVLGVVGLNMAGSH